MDISFVILTWNSGIYIPKCLASFTKALRAEKLRGEIFIVDNGSSDNTVNEAERYKNFVLEFSTHPNIQEIMQNQITILSVKVHSEWLENFNNKFLEKYEPRHSYAS